MCSGDVEIVAERGRQNVDWLGTDWGRRGDN